MSSASFELVKNAPAWQLPSTTPQQVHAELHLRVCSAPYALRLTSYPYSTASGTRTPLPLLLSSYEVESGCDAVEFVSAVSRRYVNLDERRSAFDLSHIASYTAALASLPPLIECYMHMHAAHHQTVLSEYARGVSPFHAAYLRSQRKRRVQRWSDYERIQSAEQCRARIERVLECFSRALHSSACEYLFSRQPSSADAMLAAYIAFIALAPHDDTTAPVSSTRPQSATARPVPSPASSSAASPSPFVSLSSLLSSHPLLVRHSQLVFDRYFPAFAFPSPHQADLTTAPTAAYASASAVSDYVSRSAAAAGSIDMVSGADAAAEGLLFDLRSRLSESALPAGQYRPPMSLPMRGGDQWVEQMKAAMTTEERERMTQRSRRMWLLGGAAIVFAFVLWQRSKVSPPPPTAADVNVMANSTTMSVNTSS